MKIGKYSYISKSAKIVGLNNSNDFDFEIGDNCYIGDDVQIICDNFKLGDYCKIQHHVNIHGHSVSIGHNAWIGQYTIIDGLGGARIGNNCGIGAHSQLWSHIKYGDMLEGCRFLSTSNLEVGNDVWFVGHCIISPIKAEDKSMALAGSVITSDMKYNNIYGGCPAKNLTDKLGNQFLEIPIDVKFNKLNELHSLFESNQNIKIVKNESEFIFDNNISYFCSSTRRYTKKLTEQEIHFMRYLLPEKAKFIPWQNDTI